MELQANGEVDFALYSVSEIDKNSGWSFLGEAEKYVSHSSVRFVSAVVSPDGTEMKVIATSGHRTEEPDNARTNAERSKLLSLKVAKLREKEEMRFLMEEDDEEEVTVGFADPKGEVRTITCTIPAGQRGELRKIMFVQGYDQGYCKSMD